MLHSSGMKAGQCCMLLLSICGGIVVIGGLGAATNQCRVSAYDLLAGRVTDQDLATGLGTAANNHLQAFTSQYPDGDSAYDCGIHLSLDWWLVAYEIFTFIYGMLAVFTEFFHNKFSVMTIFSVKIMLATLITSVYVKIAYTIGGGDHSDIEMGQYTRTGAAGGIVILVANYIFLCLFGADEIPSGPDGNGEEVPK